MLTSLVGSALPLPLAKASWLEKVALSPMMKMILNLCRKDGWKGERGQGECLKDGLQVRSPSQNSKGAIRSSDWSDRAINPRDKSCPDPFYTSLTVDVVEIVYLDGLVLV
jgi:hypothetical protein